MGGTQVALQKLGGAGDGERGLKGVDEVDGAEQADVEGRQILGRGAQPEGDGKPIDEVRHAAHGLAPEIGARVLGLSRQVGERIGGDAPLVPVVIHP